MHPFLPECLLITSAADMQAVSDTSDEPSPSNADATLDLNSRVASCAQKTRHKRIREPSIINAHDNKYSRSNIPTLTRSRSTPHRSQGHIGPGWRQLHVRRNVSGGYDHRGRCHNRPEQSHDFFLCTSSFRWSLPYLLVSWIWYRIYSYVGEGKLELMSNLPLPFFVWHYYF